MKIGKKEDWGSRGTPFARKALVAAVACAYALGAGAGEMESLFDDEPAARQKGAIAPAQGSGVKGHLQFEAARTVADPEHWSKLRTRGELAATGALGAGIKWKLSARADYDAVYDINDFYPADVRQSQRKDLSLRENYLDISRGNWDFRLGRQHVVWGEMVGLFFADVISARDLREFILPDFESMRIPQWAARAEYFKDSIHAELLWIPVASYDRIGKPGAEFYPSQPVFPGMGVTYLQEARPANSLDHGNYGIRLSALTGGWDISGFYYSSMDIAPTFYRQVVGTNLVYQARHERIEQIGGTLAKDFGWTVLKAEAVYTEGRRFPSLRANAPDGLVSQNTLDWAAGLDFTLPADGRLNVQYFQRIFYDHDPSIVPDREENGFSVYLTGKLADKLEAQALYISSLNRSDWLFRPKLIWTLERNWRLQLGADIFGGAAIGMFGRYDNKDRVYSEVRYSF